VFLVACAALGGGAFGSFAGVVAERGLRASLAGRSRCTSCARDLRWWELVPIVSYAALRGRCARCGARIPAGLLGREVAGGIAGAAVAISLLLVAGR
ncbi:MAG TPA: prepilin peptidase, partial [Candidatus Dormibacteraeota bacterium]|nr:prepilin peptidase [Candidatus Dormibacteraeota bacterium]